MKWSPFGSAYFNLAGGVNAYGGMGRDFGRLGRGFGAVLGRASGGGGGGPPSFFVSAAGSDSNDGRTISTPVQTLAKVATLLLVAGSVVAFRCGDTFAGTLVIPAGGSVVAPVTITSYGIGAKPIIAPAASTDGITSVDFGYITVDGLAVNGSGGTDGQGVYLQANTVSCANLIVQNCAIANMAGYGIWISCPVGNAGAALVSPVVQNNTIDACTAGRNSTSAGIRISGGLGQQNTGSNYNCTNFLIRGNSVTNCPGKTGTPSWCGSGIFAARVLGGVVELNFTNNNGANCNQTSGPSGAWASFASGVIFRKNLITFTKTASADGGGIDLDGGCDNCLVEDNITIGNAGPGLMIYEYDDATFTSNNNNVMRRNISWNDALGLRLVSGGTHDNTGQIYNNHFHTVTAGSPVRLEKLGGALTHTFANNNFTSEKAGTTDLIITSGNPSGCLFYGNNYYTPNTPRITWNGTTYATVALWRAAVAGQETIAAADTSKTVAPLHSGYAPTIRSYNAEPWRPDEASPVLNAGVDMFANFGINPGPVDFFGSPLSTSGPWSIGIACMKSAVKTVVLSTTSGSAQVFNVPADHAATFAVHNIGTGGSSNGTTAGGAGAGAYAINQDPTFLAQFSANQAVNYGVFAPTAISDGASTFFNATSAANALALGVSAAVMAEGGKTNVTTAGGIGGLAANSVGTRKFNGGNGGNSIGGFHGGGAGAAGPFGAGSNGGNGGSATTGGGGGGGADGGTAGGTSVTAVVGGIGGGGPYGPGPAGGSPTGTAGAKGTGGSGAGNAGGVGGAGGPGVEFRDSASGLFFGAGGGGGACVASATATNVGGDGGGGGGARSAANGGKGLVIYQYKTAASL